MLLFAPLARGAARTWSTIPVLLTIYALVLLWLWRTCGDRKESPPQPASPIDLPLFLFALLAVVSFIFSIYKYDSLVALLRLFAYIGLYYLLINHVDKLMFKKLLSFVIMIAAALSVFAIAQCAGVAGHSWWAPPEFAAATYVNHNHFAGYLELAIPLAIGAFFSPAAIRQRVGLFFASGTMIAAFVAAQSRGAWICLGSALVVLAILLFKRGTIRKTGVAIILLAVALIVSLAYLKGGPVSGRLKSIGDAVVSSQDREASFRDRLMIWQGAIDLIRRQPIAGVGIGDFDRGFYRFRPKGFDLRAVYAHNEYLHMAAEMGVMAPILMLWIFARIIGRGLRNSGSLAIGAGVGMLSLALHGAVDFNFHIPANMLLFTVCAAFITVGIKEGGPDVHAR